AGRTLQVFIAADTKKFRDGLDDAERRMKGFDGSIGGLAGSMRNVLGPAMLAAGAAAGALAAKFAVDGIQAAAEQEQMNLKLAKSFESVGLSQDVGKAQEYIDTLQRQVGISEDQLSPALGTLVSKTGSLTEAQSLLGIAMDTATAKGIPLESITKALAKAQDGNYKALASLVPELDKAALKTGGLESATNQLQQLFGGTASEQAETFKGKIERLKIGAGELQEAFGTGFLEGIQTAMDKLNGDDSLGQTMRDLEPTFQDLGKNLGSLLADLAVITTAVQTVMKAMNDWKDSIPGLGSALDVLTRGPIRILADALRELNSLMGQGTPSAGFAPNAGSGGGGGGGGGAFTPTTTLGTPPVSSSRTPTVVAPLSAIAAATRNQARRTSGRVVLLG
ncbi:MAG: hypothetical protein ACO3WK_13510, partial [Steroidobacteraceae bacterium]